MADRHDPNTVYVMGDDHKSGDFSPYLLKSTDRGESWTRIDGDLPDRHLVWRMTQDHVDPDLLFAGTEFGIFFTVDGGENWQELGGGVPTISFRDIHIQREWNDLVGGSFGRGIFVLDDYTPLRELTPELLNQEAVLFDTRDAHLGGFGSGTPEGRRLRLVLSGIGPDVEAARSAAATAGLSDVVELTGYAGYHDADQVYRRGDIFVSPTYAEGFSNTILEAMACAAPVVASDTAPVREAVTDGATGLLADFFDPEALAGAAARLLDDRDLARRLGQAARRAVVADYDTRLLLPRHLELVRNLAAAADVPPAAGVAAAAAALSA